MIRQILIKSSKSRLPDGALKTNFGDLLRAAILFDSLPPETIWMTDSEGKDLLQWFVHPDRLALFNELENLPLTKKFTVYNLDNYISVDNIFRRRDWKWKGFLPAENSHLRPQNESIAALQPYTPFQNGKSFQQNLLEGFGFPWQCQDYPNCSLEYPISHNIGLNWQVHPQWKSKQWSLRNWSVLADELQKDCSISWQKGLNDFGEYLRWIASCRVIVTQDSLGLHLASALKKKVVALVGPTESGEYDYGRVTFIRPEPLECMPCNSPLCLNGGTCLDNIEPQSLAGIVIQQAAEDLISVI